MKKLFLFFGLLASSYSQELMNFYIESSGLNEVRLHTLVYKNTFTSLGSYSVSVVDNTITVTLCYLNTSGQSITLDPQINDINLPNGFSTYTINIELYGDDDAVQPCSLENLVDTGNITFEYPYNPTATTYIPDNVFEDYLEDLGFGDDIPNNDLVFTHRIVNMTNLFIGNIAENIASLDGIEDFAALKDLRCGGHQITNIDISNNINLKWLWCFDNPINQLDVSNNINLTWLWASELNLTELYITNNVNLERLDIRENNLSTIDLSQNENLKFLQLSFNQFENIDVSNNNLLEEFVRGYNLLSSIDVTNNSILKVLSFSNNNISSVDLLNNNILEWLFIGNNLITEVSTTNLNNLILFDCSNNQITSLDFSLNPQLELVSVYNNNLTSLNIKNGNNSNIETFYALNNDDLYCIDVDDEVAANNGEFPYSDWYVEDQVVFSEDCSLGLETFLENKISLYPNPTQEVLYLDSDVSIDLIQVYDLLGRLVAQENNPTGQLDVSNIASGLLFVQLETDEGVLVKKVVKE